MPDQPPHPDKRLNVVLLPAADCTIDLATVPTGWLTGLLNLESQDAVSIVQQSSSCLRLSCRDFSVKQHLLSWDTRSTAERQFAVRVKDDLWKFERVQKARMWPVMRALFEAGLRPTWSRAAVTWRTLDKRFFIHLGELPESLSAADIVAYAKSGCTVLPSCAPVESSSQADAVCQTDHPQPPHSASSASQHLLVTSLRQDLAQAKQRIAVQSVQCCFWRRKYQLYEAKVGPPKLTKHSSAQTTSLVDVLSASTQTHTPVDPDAICNFEIPGGPTLSVPKSALTALKILQDWCSEKIAEAIARYEPLLKELRTDLVQQHAAMQALRSKLSEPTKHKKKK